MIESKNINIGNLITDGTNIGYVREICYEAWPVLCEVLIKDYSGPNIICIKLKDIRLLPKLHFRIMKFRRRKYKI